MTKLLDLLPFCGEQTVLSAAEDYFTRDVLMSVLAGGHLGKMFEKVYAIIVIAFFDGSGSMKTNVLLLALWSLGLLVVLYVAAHWRTITDTADSVSDTITE
jgi:hypothetical protein